MPNYQYKVVPAPQKGLKAKGIRTPEARFANALAELMNTMGADGWEYQRAETLPSVERAGLTKTTTEWRNVLVFRKPRADDIEPFAPELLAAPAPAPLQMTDDVPEISIARDAPAAPAAAAPDDDHPAGQEGATQMLKDNGVEETSEVAGMTNSLERLAASRKTEKSDG